ncbi:hypothetical protein AB0I94_02265 [Streptomyces sp. NPDC050147]|uniref:hypothetical protein n=1 Tax=Streptomyces sp. NPDC050147 TaxID=3155513 RepID=UPI003429BBC9
MKPTRVELLDDNGEWQPLHGITNIVIYDEPEHARALADRIREVQNAMTDLMHAYAEAIRPVMEELGRAFQTMREAGLVEDDGKPARRPDRPAWQSPYGPPTRRH